jgi:hypothetical protein
MENDDIAEITKWLSFFFLSMKIFFSLHCQRDLLKWLSNFKSYLILHIPFIAETEIIITKWNLTINLTELCRCSNNLCKII